MGTLLSEARIDLHAETVANVVCVLAAEDGEIVALQLEEVLVEVIVEADASLTAFTLGQLPQLGIGALLGVEIVPARRGFEFLGEHLTELHEIAVAFA